MKSRIAKVSVGAGATVALAAGALVVYDQSAAAYSGLARSSAESYAHAGLNERYVFGGTTFYDNDSWDGNEGIDCSAYVSKAWALPYYMDPMDTTRLNPPMYTGTWWEGQADGAVEIGWNDGDASNNYVANYMMNAFVWHSYSGGSQHMGLLYSFDYGAGTYKTWEALGSSYGVLVQNHTWQDMETHASSNGGKRYRRADWSS
jgi:cell wall-associated NlpC family hydrolase